ITGLQDNLTTLFSLGLATGASSWEAAILANLSTGVMMQQLGAKNVSNTEMKVALEKILQEKNY
ncbi:MAG: D-glycero-beta-D-manno-heptose-7-phosphate kinase, partial [Cyanobacteria bacterium J06639_18]